MILKKSYIIGILAIIAAIVIFMSASGDVSTYGNFTDANSTGKVKVSGTLDLEKELYYDPNVDPNYFSFYMIDNLGDSKKVILTKPKPQDFELSEQVVVTGSMNEDAFVASEVLTKCPSKYKDEEILLKADS